MHEFSIAADIMEMISEFAAAHPDKEVQEVCLQIGELTCIEAEQLNFCYESFIRNSPVKNSRLAIESVPASVHCTNCNYQGPPRRWDSALTVSVATLQCPQCGHGAKATAGHECDIKSVRFTQRQTDSPM